MMQRNRPPIALRTFENETDALARHEIEATVPQGADTDLRALQILQDADGPTDLGFEGTDGGMDLRVVGLNAVAEIESEGVDTGQEQGLQHVRRVGRRTDGGDDLGVAVTTHAVLGQGWPPSSL